MRLHRERQRYRCSVFTESSLNITVEFRRKRIDETGSEAWPEGRCRRAIVTDPAYDLGGVGGDRNENFAAPWRQAVARRIGDKLGNDKSDAPAAHMVERHGGHDSKTQGRAPPLEFRRHFGLAKPRHVVAKVSGSVDNGRQKHPMSRGQLDQMFNDSLSALFASGLDARDAITDANEIAPAYSLLTR